MVQEKDAELRGLREEHERSKANYEAEIRRLRAQIERRAAESPSAGPSLPPAVAATKPEPAPAEPRPEVRGMVQAASAKDDVYVLAVGAKDGVAAGDALTVSRNDEYVSTLVVDKVWPNYSTARTKPGTRRREVQAGDEVVRWADTPRPRWHDRATSSA